MPSHARGRIRWLVILLLAVLLAGLGGCAGSGSGDAARSPDRSEPLARWREALAHGSSRPVTWVACGDSITEGQGASSRANRWIDRTLLNLRRAGAAGQRQGGVGYLPGWYAVSGPDSPWLPYAARTGAIYNASSGSLGMRTALLPEGATQTYRVSGTSADIYYGTSGGAFSYSVDGATPTVFDAAGTLTTANRLRVKFSARAAHTVTIRAVAGTTALEGLAVYNGDEAAGIRLFDDAHSGYTSTDFAQAEPDIEPIVAMLDPDLVTIALGVNDYLRGTASPAQLKANLQHQITNLRDGSAVRPPSIALVITYGIGVAPKVSSYRWNDYADALRSIAKDDPTVGVLDLTAMGISKPGGLWAADALHPSDRGNLEMARRATDFLNPA